MGSIAILNTGYSIIENKKKKLQSYRSLYIYVNTLFYILIISFIIITVELHINVVAILLVLILSVVLMQYAIFVFNNKNIYNKNIYIKKKTFNNKRSIFTSSKFILKKAANLLKSQPLTSAYISGTIATAASVSTVYLAVASGTSYQELSTFELHYYGLTNMKSDMQTKSYVNDQNLDLEFIHKTSMNAIKNANISNQKKDFILEWLDPLNIKEHCNRSLIKNNPAFAKPNDLPNVLNSFENSENLKLALSNYSDKQRGVTFQLKIDSKNDVEVIATVDESYIEKRMLLEQQNTDFLKIQYFIK